MSRDSYYGMFLCSDIARRHAPLSDAGSLESKELPILSIVGLPCRCMQQLIHSHPVADFQFH